MLKTYILHKTHVMKLLKFLHIQYHIKITSTDIKLITFVQKNDCVKILTQGSLTLLLTSKNNLENEKIGSVPAVKLLYVSIIF